MATRPWTLEENQELTHLLLKLPILTMCRLIGENPNADELRSLIATGRIRNEGLTVSAIRELRGYRSAVAAAYCDDVHG